MENTDTVNRQQFLNMTCRTTAELILADPAQIHQIIMNLCTNAVHAMGGEVGVLTAKLEPVELDSDTARQTAGLSPGDIPV